MLTSLRVQDLAVLEDVEVSFEEGLTVLTGETGAGKSLVVDALALLSGERADASLVRSGAEKAVVEGAFLCDGAEVARVLADAGLREDAEAPGPFEVVVRREVGAAGKGRLFLDGSPAPLKTLQEIAPKLLVLYGQAEARELLDPAAPRELLDRFAGLAEKGVAVSAAHGFWRAADAERRRVAGAAEGRGTKLELLEFQIREIDAVKPLDGEEAALQREKGTLASVEKRGRLLADAVSALESEDGGALTALASLRKTFQALAELDAASAERLAAVEDLVDRVSDLAASTSRDLERLEADPERLAHVAERLDAMAKLKRKYGPEIADVIATRERLGRERDELADLEGALRKAEAAADAAFETYRKAALDLSAARAAAAPRLAESVVRHLKDLAFLSASLSVDVTRRPDPASAFRAGGESVAFGAHGIDVVALAFAPNPGEPPRPLMRIASGGELSRVQLAVAAALAESEAADPKRKATERKGGPVRTFVFDEVDAGVSGRTAEAVGRKLRTLAGREQVLVVTHLPQVAAAGDRHLAVSKEAAKGRTRTRVEALDAAGRVDAIAAMLAGAEVGEAARKQAKALLSSRR